MKILIATDCYIFNMNGVTTCVLALCSALRRCGHEVRTLSLSNTNRSFRKGDDFFIRSFPAFYYPGMRISFAQKDPLLKEIESWEPEVIHVHTDGSAYRMTLLIRKHKHIPLVKTCHTNYDYYVFGAFWRFPLFRALSRFAGERLYRTADKVTTPSPKLAHFPFLSSQRDRLVIVPNGIDLEKYRNRFSEKERETFRKTLGISGCTGVLVTASRLSKEKNMREMISLFSAVLKRRQDVKYLIVGDGPDRKQLKKMTEKLKISSRVIFTGKVPSEDIWRYYAAGDIYVADSTFEVHSMSYLEAMASGLPLLCRADDCLDGVLAHGINGLVWNSGEEFVDFVCRLLTEDSTREEMGRCSLRKAERFSADAFASSMLRVYEAAIYEKQKHFSKEEEKHED